MKTNTTRTFASLTGRAMRPTQKHTPVMWEGILGTVYAVSPEGVVRYFDYDWDAARAHVALSDDADVRIARATRSFRLVKSDTTVYQGKMYAWAVR
ncbi:hypothetical protein PP304_gp124 [Gordonia phage Phendrix]|uniref:Uncharacterized protein n=1 Tax=Gordonia phage Phendrix TaxID=2593335 RepID=A0A514U1F3_9CAUD|nr:hypothetical protein PP304_gp013 [Gordonia phage Phendrix]YP_010649243.1 hypothetical protein PP304_gp124 [Gordonia phage Phendrix]QDK02561.1 hypothetical protein SEA_PHENDRIX_13 [Gordonia phage Phendrix]QDK02745.1 hypothetical protein SEA_PHENDRIX_229 [Gordonia phage Phendrix]